MNRALDVIFIGAMTSAAVAIFALVIELVTL